MPFIQAPQDATTASLRPGRLCHIALRTTPENYNAMCKFWADFLGADIFPGEFITFFRFDEEHHRIAILKVSGLSKEKSTSSGLEHVSLGYDSFKELAAAYKARKARGYLPVWCTNHGITTSMYYADPDGNHIECQIENFAAFEDAIEFMHSNDFVKNPIGEDYDPEELVRKVEAGESHEALVKRLETGVRASVPKAYMDFQIGGKEIPM